MRTGKGLLSGCGLDKSKLKRRGARFARIGRANRVDVGNIYCLINTCKRHAFKTVGHAFYY